VRADRLLSIVLLLQVHRRMTARELAERLEVSERTIYRDLDALSAAGIPVYAQRGTGGGCLLPDGYRTSLTGLTDPEVQALFVAKPAHLLADLGLGGAAEVALLKLMAALPARARENAEQMRQRIHIDTAGWTRPDDAAPCLPALLEAIWQERKVRITYQRGGDAPYERLVDPLGLVARGSIWYLVAGADGQVRTYRVSRVRAVAATDEPAARPPGFDLAAHWQASSESFRAAIPKFPATLRVHASVFPRLRAAWRYAHVDGAEPPGPDGWVRAAVTFESEEEACGYVLGLAPYVEIVEPAALRERVLTAARDAAALHESAANPAIT
jgi:predicted DNA-binding transcriptional regulator YafY